MSWIAITNADLNATKVAALVAALQSAGLGEGQSDPLAEHIAEVTARIRAEVKGCQRNLVDRDTTKIPGDLKSLACRLIYAQAAGRLQIELTQDERDQKRVDEDYLRAIRRCEVPIAAADDPVEGETQSPTNSPRITPRITRFDQASQEGV